MHMYECYVLCMKRNVFRDQAAREALTPEQQCALDGQETIIPDPRASRVQQKQADARGIVAQLLAYVGKYNPFGSKKA
jgi:hypothetical protein